MLPVAGAECIGQASFVLPFAAAYGKFPIKAVTTQSTVALRTEAAMMRYQVKEGKGVSAESW
jgi:hypothetical protein